MPTLFCKPENNFTNRLITILSCLRIARLWGYDFILIWQIEKDKSATFHNCLSDFFNLDFQILRELPANINLRVASTLPENARVCIRPESLCDVLMDRWAHVQFDISELGSSDLQSQVGKQLRQIFSSNFNTSLQLNQLAATLGYPEINPEISVHYRKGAWILERDKNLPMCTTSSENITLLAKHIIKQRNLESAFVCGSDTNSNHSICKDLTDDFPHLAISVSRAVAFDPSFVNTGIAILDFLTLIKSSYIVNSGISTFSAFAAFIGSAKLTSFVSDTEYVSVTSELGAGHGL